MAYIAKKLSPNETIRHVGKVSWWSLVPRLTLGVSVLVVLQVVNFMTFANTEAGFFSWALFAILGLCLTSALVASRLVTILTTEIVVTNQRIVSKHGWLNVQWTSTDIDKVNNINVNQPLLGRLFHYGDINITTATAEEKDNHTIKMISRPESFDQALRAEQESHESSASDS